MSEQQNDKSILIHQGFLYRLSEHKKLWNLRGIYIYYDENEQILIQIVKADEITTFFLEDVVEMYIFQNDDFKVCLNLHIDNKIITLASTPSYSEVTTMLFLICATYFELFSENLIQKIFYYSLIAFGNNNDVCFVDESILPIVEFESVYCKIELMESIVDCMKEDSDVLTNADDFNSISESIVLIFKLIFESIILSLCESRINPIVELLHFNNVQIKQIEKITFTLGFSVICIQNSELYVNVNQIPKYIFDQIKEQYHETHLLTFINKYSKQYISLSFSDFEVLRFVQYGSQIDISQIKLVQDFKQSWIASFALSHGIVQIYEDFLYDLLTMHYKPEFQELTINFINETSPYEDFLYKFMLLPQASENVQLFYKNQLLKQELIQLEDDVINYFYQIKATSWYDCLMTKIFNVVVQFTNSFDFEVIMQNQIANPQISLFVFVQDLSAPHGVVLCYLTEMSLKFYGNILKCYISAVLQDKYALLELQKLGKLNDEIDVQSTNQSIEFEEIENQQETSEDFEHIPNMNELRVKLNHQSRGSNFCSFSVVENQSGSKFRLSQNQIAYSELNEDGVINELQIGQLVYDILKEQLIERQKSTIRREAIQYLNYQLRKCNLADATFQVLSEEILIHTHDVQIEMLFDFYIDNNLPLFRSSSLILSLLKIAKRFNRTVVVLQQYANQRFKLSKSAVYLNFIVFEGKKIKLLKGLENYF